MKDLDPILDAMRTIKSPREIAVIREATRITGLAILEAMRDTRPGMYEYELQADAEFVFKKHGAYGPSYFALIATGTNSLYSHYHRNTAKLADGDLVQFDYAPDYKYYQSDVTRVFPANGRFTPRQREFYTIYLRLYQALMTSIKVRTAPREIIRNAVVRMDAILAGYPFTDARIKAAATAFVERYRTSNANSLGHSVGMEVHDVGRPAPTLEPGMIFTIEPAMQIPEEHLGIRLEDMILDHRQRIRKPVSVRPGRARRDRARDARAGAVEEASVMEERRERVGDLRHRSRALIPAPIPAPIRTDPGTDRAAPVTTRAAVRTPLLRRERLAIGAVRRQEERRRARAAPIPAVAVGGRQDAANAAPPAPRARRGMVLRLDEDLISHDALRSGPQLIGSERDAVGGVSSAESAGRHPSDSPSSSGTSTSPRETTNAPCAVLTIPRIRCGC